MICSQEVACDLHMADGTGCLRSRADRYPHFLRHHVGELIDTLFVGRDDAVDQCCPLFPQCLREGLKGPARCQRGLVHVGSHAARGNGSKRCLRVRVCQQLLAGLSRLLPAAIDVKVSVMSHQLTPLDRPIRSYVCNHRRKR